MRKKSIIGMALTMAALILLVLSAPILNELMRPAYYEKTIIRNTEGADEEKALLAAESVDHAEIFWLSRFEGSTDPNEYLYQEPGVATYAFFIDTETLKYYDTRFEDLKGRGYPRGIEFSYETNVHTYGPIHVVYSSRDSIQVFGSNGSILFENREYTGPSWGMRFALSNGSGYAEIQPEELDLDFPDCFLVEMKLRYSEYYAPMAAFISEVYQIILVDECFVPLLLCVESKMMVS